MELTKKQIKELNKAMTNYVINIKEIIGGDVATYMNEICNLAEKSIAAFALLLNTDLKKLDYIDKIIDEIKSNVKKEVFGNGK